MNRARYIFIAVVLLMGCADSFIASPGTEVIQTPPTAGGTVGLPTMLARPSQTLVATSLPLPIRTAVLSSPASIPPTPVPQPILASSSVPLSASWQTVEWEGLMIPIPPQGSWDPDIKLDPASTTIPVLAAGAVTYPTITGTVELPFGPIFKILEFSGSLNDWLTHERSTNSLAVDQQTVHDTMIAGHPAKVYQPVVTGTCYTGAYVVTLDERRLLWIWTDCLEQEPYDRVIKGLQIKAQ